MAHRTLIACELRCDDSDTPLLLYGIRESVLVRCPDLNCEVAVIEPLDEKHAIDKAITGTIKKAQAIVETTDNTLCAYMTKEAVDFEENAEHPKFELRGTFIVVVSSTKLLSFTWKAEDPKAQVPAGVLKEFGGAADRIITPLRKGRFPHEERIGDRLDIAMKEGIQDVFTTLSTQRARNNLN